MTKYRRFEPAQSSSLRSRPRLSSNGSHITKAADNAAGEEVPRPSPAVVNNKEKTHMDKPAVAKGTFADFKILKTRKIAQFIIEMSIDDADESLVMLGGVPKSDRERLVAIARLDQTKTERTPITLVPKKSNGADTSPRPFCDLSYCQQAGIKSQDTQFQLWMSVNYPQFDKEDCAEAIRQICRVDSRKKILPGTAAGAIWKNLLREYERYSQ